MLFTLALERLSKKIVKNKRNSYETWFQIVIGPIIPTFQCKVRGKKIEAEYETCNCTHSHNCHEQRNPECCGQPMLEIIED
jgi:hypothetical protein